jgi:DNA repair protein RecO (recombination protein O)
LYQNAEQASTLPHLLSTNAPIEYNAPMSIKARTIRTDAIVLRHRDWGEADRLLWLYTRKEGKVQAIAKGVRKIRSRKAGHLEPFTSTNLLLARGRDFFIITQAETIDPYLTVRQDLIRVGYASYVVELLDRFTYDMDNNLQLYYLLKETLTRLNEEAEPSLPVRYYEIRLLDLLGYRPNLFQCVNCESEIKPEDQFFSIALGGVLCPNCGPGISGVKRITMNTLKYLRHFQRSSYGVISNVHLSPELNHKLESLMQEYFKYFLERDLNTPTFLQRVKDHPNPE